MGCGGGSSAKLGSAQEGVLKPSSLGHPIPGDSYQSPSDRGESRSVTSSFCQTSGDKVEKSQECISAFLGLTVYLDFYSVDYLGIPLLLEIQCFYAVQAFLVLVMCWLTWIKKTASHINPLPLLSAPFSISWSHNLREPLLPL